MGYPDKPDQRDQHSPGPVCTRAPSTCTPHPWAAGPAAIH